MNNATILAVDDTSESLALLANVLTPAGYQVRLADSGELAMAAVAANPPDLILLDVRMQGINGLEVCRWLKTREESRHIPIILISAFADVNEWVEGLRLGAADYITKPLRPEELLTRVKTHLSLSQANASLAQHSAVLRQTNDQLQSEVIARQRVEHELRQSLDRAERSRRAMLSTLEDQKQAEERLRESRRLMKDVLDNSSSLVYICDVEGRFLLANRKLETVIGVAHGLTIGQPRARFLPKELADRHSQNDLRVIRAGQPLDFEEENIESDGRHTYATVKFPLRDAQGQIYAIGGMSTDITDRKRAEERLRIANSQLAQAVTQAEELAVRAEAASRAKSEFLANMSHEIRTPMAAIIGFAELLLSGTCPPREQHEHLSTIQRNAENLLTLINDILDLSKIEAERLQLESLDRPPRQIVEDVVTLMRSRANEKRLSLEVLYVDPLPSVIHTDPTRLRQILVNLVGNAIKFTDSGGVRVTVRWIPAQSGPAQMQFAVTDSGIGISAEGVQGLFEPFSQVDMSSTRRFGGTGLGLSISQRLAELLHGRIDVQSELGQGSTFTLTIDAGTVKPGEMPTTISRETTAADRPLAELCESLHGRVLLVEDVWEMAQLMRCTLEKTCVEIDLAENGVVGYEKATASKAAGAPYDLILMDIRMPVMDGYEATRRLRAVGWQGPIVALTAHSMRGDRERCLDAGCNDFLSKPVGQAAFFDILMRYLGRTDATTPKDAGDAPSPGRTSVCTEMVDHLVV